TRHRDVPSGRALRRTLPKVSPWWHRRPCRGTLTTPAGGNGSVWPSGRAHISQFAETRFWSFREIAPQIQTAPGLEPTTNAPACSPLARLLARRGTVTARADETTLGSEG